MSTPPKEIQTAAAAPDLPLDILNELDRQLNAVKWTVPIKADGALPALLNAAIQLVKSGVADRPNLNRFISYSLHSAFEKLLNSEETKSWKPPVQKQIRSSAEKLVQLISFRIDLNSQSSLLSYLSWLFDANGFFHIKNAFEPSNIDIESNPIIFTISLLDPLLPQAWLTDFINIFGNLGGFDKIVEAVQGANNGFHFALLIEPLSHIAKFLKQEYFTKYVTPIESEALRFLSTLNGENLKTHSMNLAKNDSLYRIIHSLKMICRVSHSTTSLFDNDRVYDAMMLDFILKLIKGTTFNGAMYGLSELRRIVQNVTQNEHALATSTSISTEAQWLTSLSLSEWLSSNNVIPLLFSNHLHHAQYVSKLEEIISFQIKQSSLSHNDLTLIWDSQVGKHEVVENNIFDLLSRLAIHFDGDQHDHLFACFQRSFGGTTRNMEKLLDFIRKLAEDDVEGQMALKVMDKLWGVAHDQDTPLEIIDSAIKSHVKLLDISNIKNKDAQREKWIVRCFDEISKNNHVITCIRTIRELTTLYPQDKPRIMTVPVVTRSELWKFLTRRFDVKGIVAESFFSYMSKAREHSSKKGGEFMFDRYHHNVNIEVRLNLLKAIHLDLNEYFSDELVSRIWETLIEKPSCLSDREWGFLWFMDSTEDFEPKSNRFLFVKRVMKLDTKTLLIPAFDCAEKYFYDVNFPNNSNEQNNVKFDTTQSLIGLDFIWAIALENCNDDVANRAIELLKRAHSLLTTRLTASASVVVHDKFLQDCMDRIIKTIPYLKTTKPHKDQALFIKTLERCLSLLHDYIEDAYLSADPRKRFSRHGTSFRGEELNLEIQTTSIFRIPIHSNETLAYLREIIAKQVNVATNYFYIYIDNRYVGPELNSQTLGSLEVFPESTVVLSYVNMSNDAPLPLYIPQTETIMSMETLVPGYRLAHKAEYMERLFELTELPFESVRLLASRLLLSIPTDPVELTRTITRVRTVTVSDARTQLQLLCLKPRSVFRRLYNLQLLSSIIQPSLISKQSQDLALQFRQAFVDATGLQFLTDVLASSKDVVAAEAVNDSRETYILALRLLRFLLWRGIHLDLKVLPSGPALESVGPEQKSEFFRKVAQEQRQALAIDRSLLLPAKPLFESLINIIWRSALGNWKSKSYIELSDITQPSPSPSLVDTWLAHEALHLLSFMMNLTPMYASYFSEFPHFAALHRDVLLRSPTARIRWLFYTKPLDSVIAKLLSKTWETLQALLSTTEFYPDTCKEFFDYSSFVCSKIIEAFPNTNLTELLNTEINWIQNLIGKGEGATEQALLAGHLLFCRKLISVSHTNKSQIGSLLLQNILFKLLFPASARTVDLKAGQKDLDEASSNIQPLCTSSVARIAAYELIMELSLNSVQNLERTIAILSHLHDRAIEKITEWEYYPLISGKSSSGYVGLKNAGATCYMNSVVQQLFMQLPIRNAILSAGEVPDPSKLTSLLRSMQVLFSSLQNSHMQYSIPEGLWTTYRHQGQPVNVREQLDAFECFNQIVDQVDEGLKELGHKTIVNSVFDGCFAVQKIIKSGCSHSSEINESFTSIGLDVRYRHNLIEALEQYVQGDLLEGGNAYKCETCNEKRDCLKRSCIKTLPNTLVIHLKRFDFDWEREQPVKLNDYFEFPREFDIGPFTKEGLAFKEGNQGKSAPLLPENEYVLTGIVIHSGQANGGHYYSFIRQKDQTNNLQKWLRFDDAEISDVDLENNDILSSEAFGGEYTTETTDQKGNIITKRRERFWNAYILFYERKSPSLSSLLSSSASSLSLENNPHYLSLLRDVREENLKYYHRCEMFNSDYFRFVRGLCSANDPRIPSTLSPNDKLAIATLSMNFSLDFLVNIGFHTHKAIRGVVGEWSTVFAALFCSFDMARKRFADYLTEQPQVILQLLLQCSSTEIRTCFADICREFFFSVYSKEPIMTATESSLFLLTERFAPLLQKEVIDHWRHFGQYFQVFYQYAELGVLQRHHLLSMSALQILVKFVLTNTFSHKFHRPDYLYLTRLICCLVRSTEAIDYQDSSSCEDASSVITTNVFAYNYGLLDSSYTSVPFKLPKDVAFTIFESHELVTFLLHNIALDEPLVQFLQFASWNNKKFSTFIAQMMLDKVVTGVAADLRPHLNVLFALLHIPDELQEDRLVFIFEDKQFGIFECIHHLQKNFAKHAYLIFKFIARLLQSPIKSSLTENFLLDRKAKWGFSAYWIEAMLGRLSYTGVESLSNDASSSKFVIDRTKSALELIDFMKPFAPIEPHVMPTSLSEHDADTRYATIDDDDDDDDEESSIDGSTEHQQSWSST